MHSRHVTAFINVDAALAAAASQAMTFNNGQTTFEVPTDYALLLFAIMSTIFSGTIAFDISDRERTYRLPAHTVQIEPPISFPSGSRVTANIINTSPTTASGSATVYGLYFVLVPSNDFDETKWPENVPPYYPRPF